MGPIFSPTVTRPLRGALVGFGFIAEKGHSPEYRKRAESSRDVAIVAVADGCAARREAARRALPNVRVYPDHRALFDAEARELDFVDVAAPPYVHVEVAHAALDHGLHVLCEKPLAVSLDAAHGLVEHALRAGRVLFPCHNYRHAPVVEAVRKLLGTGAIGRVHLVTMHTFRPTHARGVAEWRPDWRRERRFSGGGIGTDHGIHTLYLAFEWMGAYPIAVSAKSWHLDQRDTEDNFSCSLTFPNAIATVHLSWTAGMRRVMYTLHGDKGSITVDDDDVRLVRNNGATHPDAAVGLVQTTAASQWADASHRDWFGSLLDRFKDAVARGDCVSGDTLDAVRAVGVITTAYASAQQGSVELPLSASSDYRSEHPRPAMPAVPAGPDLVSR
jgi:predicted dehydrogenase